MQIIDLWHRDHVVEGSAITMYQLMACGGCQEHLTKQEIYTRVSSKS